MLGLPWWLPKDPGCERHRCNSRYQRSSSELFPAPRGPASQGSRKAERLDTERTGSCSPLTLSLAFVNKRACLFFIIGFVLQSKVQVTLSWPSLEVPGTGFWGAQQEDPGRASALLAFAALFFQRLLVRSGGGSLLLLQS